MRRRKGTRSLKRLPRAPQRLPATGLLCCPMAPTPHRYTAVKYYWFCITPLQDSRGCGISQYGIFCPLQSTLILE